MKLEDIGFLEVVEERIQRITPGKISYCEWIITSKCNFNCPYCNKLSTKDFSLSRIEKFIKILSSMECKYVHLTGGEATIRKDLVDIISLLKENNIRVGLSTNGSYDKYLLLLEAGIELFSISLDVHQKDLNEKFIRIKNNVFDTVVSNIKELSKLVYVNVGIVINDDNVNHINDIISFVSDLGPSDIRIGTATKFNKIIKLDIDEKILAKHPILKYRVQNFNSGQNMRGSELSSTSKCHLIRDDLTILGEDFYPCAVYAREKGSPIGKFDSSNIEKREEWFAKHNSYNDPICKKFCMDFKCMFNSKVEQYEEMK